MWSVKAPQLIPKRRPGRPGHSESFKQKAVELALNTDLTYAQIGAALGIHRVTVSAWINQANEKARASEQAPGERDAHATASI